MNNKLWKITFTIDTGYTWFERDCIVIACDEESALKNFNKWITPKLHGERFVEDELTKTVELSADDYGVIYQNYIRS